MSEQQIKLPLMTSPSEMVREYIHVSDQTPDKLLYEGLIIEEYGEWVGADNDVEEIKELSDLIYVLYGYAHTRGWDLDEAVRRVHENNMGRMYQEDGTIWRRDDGKIIKNKSYPKVQLEDLVL